MSQANAGWQLITHLGSASLLMPILAITATGLWRAGQENAVRVWLMALALGVAITVASKILFLGWGMGIAFLDFTGVSGHTLLASSILPVLFFSVEGGTKPRVRTVSLWLGLAFSLAVGISRIVLGMHSPSEVVAGWLLGLAISGAVLKALENLGPRQGYMLLPFLVLFLAFGSTTSSYLPTHDMEIRLALLLSGRDKPFTRAHLASAARAAKPDGMRQ